MKNSLTKTLCVLCIIAVIFTTFGCSKKENKNTNADGNVVDFSQMKTEDGTAVITQEHTNADGKKETVTEIVDVDFVNKPIFDSSNLTSRENFASEIGPDCYEMPNDVAKDVNDKPEDWKEFYYVKYIENKSSKILACKSVKVENNGKNGIWVNTNLDAEYTTGAKSSLPLSIWAIADMSKFKNNDEIKAAFDKIKISLEYTLVDSALGDIDWENAEIKTMEIN